MYIVNILPAGDVMGFFGRFVVFRPVCVTEIPDAAEQCQAADGNTHAHLLIYPC